jgi:hypothetical protein
MTILDTKSQQFIDGIALRLGCEFEADAEAIQISKRTLPEICRLSNEAEELDGGVSNYDQVRAAFSFTTLFSSALSNALSKTVLDLYAGTITSWQRIFNKAEVSRLDTERVVLEPLASPPEVPGGADYPSSEGGGDIYPWKLAKYGRTFVVSFEAILNDDIGLLRRLLNEHISACKRLEDDLAFGLLMANPTMNDGAVFFCSNHSNLLTTNGLTSTNLGKALVQLQHQTSKTGVSLRLRPTVLLVPPELFITAIELAKTAMLIVTQGITPTATPPLLQGSYNALSETGLQVVAESRLSGLSGGSTTTWYLGCDPKQIDSFVVGFLEGQTEPQVIPQRKDLKIDGQQYLVRHIAGVKGVFPQSLIKNTA